MSTYYSFHRPTWERNYFSDYKPFGWRCGKCCIGQLRANVTDKILRGRRTKRFVCQLRCTDSTCDEVYYVIGNWGKYSKRGIEISIDYEGKDCERWFFPSAFEPTLSFFSCEASTPDSVKNGLEEAFKLYWISAPACANAIRKVLDRLMEHHQVSGKTLDQKLVQFGQTHPGIAKRLQAVKWIGNEGSHQNDLERSDVLDGFELLAAVLAELFPDNAKDQRLNDITNDVNSIRKPRSKK